MKKQIVLIVSSLFLSQITFSAQPHPADFDTSSISDLLAHDPENTASTITAHAMPSMPKQPAPMPKEPTPMPKLPESMPTPGMFHPKIAIPEHALTTEAMLHEPKEQKTTTTLPQGLANAHSEFSKDIDALNSIRTQMWQQFIPQLFASDIPIKFSLFILQGLFSADQQISGGIEQLLNVSKHFNESPKNFSNYNHH